MVTRPSKQKAPGFRARGLSAYRAREPDEETMTVSRATNSTSSRGNPDNLRAGGGTLLGWETTELATATIRTRCSKSSSRPTWPRMKERAKDDGTTVSELVRRAVMKEYKLKVKRAKA